MLSDLSEAAINSGRFAMEEKMRILCYGDSNTWGYTPGSGVRFDENTRWTALMQKELGEKYRVLESGMNGRTTVYDDPVNPYRNGRKGLGYALQSEKPIDLVVLCLGTNDLHFTNIAGAARGMDEVLRTIYHSGAIYNGSTPVFGTVPRVLLVAPIALHENYDQLREGTLLCGRVEDSRRFAEFYRPLAEKYGAAFLDASAVAKASAVDGIHMDAESHRRLAPVIAAEVRRIMEQ